MKHVFLGSLPIGTEFTHKGKKYIKTDDEHAKCIRDNKVCTDEEELTNDIMILMAVFSGKLYDRQQFACSEVGKTTAIAGVDGSKPSMHGSLGVRKLAHSQQPMLFWHGDGNRQPSAMKLFSVILIGALCMQGCIGDRKPDYTNIPLTQGDAPYRLPKGIYTDTRGVVHNEGEYRWSISESDLFNVSDEDYLVRLKKK